MGAPTVRLGERRCEQSEGGAELHLPKLTGPRPNGCFRGHTGARTAQDFTNQERREESPSGLG